MKTNGFFAITAKELNRFFTDKRMVFTTILLPGLMIYLLYSFMGTAMQNSFVTSDDYVPQVYTVNLPASIEALGEQAGLDFVPIQASQSDAIKANLTDKSADLLAVFPANFDAQLAQSLTADTAQAASQVPQVELFYNSTRKESATAFTVMSGLLDGYKNAIAPVFAVNAGSQQFDLASDRDAAGFMFASLLPMLMMIFLFSGSMGVGTESIAGEKERGTMATMLVTPLKRWELALGKVVSISVIGLLSGLSSFVGVMLSLPKMTGMTADAGIDASIYGPADYLMLLVVVLSTVLLFVGLISLVSAFAKSVKEAAQLVMPLMILAMLVGVLAMFSQTAQSQLYFYLIPAYNSVQCFVAIFSFGANALHVAVTVGINLLVAGLCVVALTRMFESERIVFAR